MAHYSRMANGNISPNRFVKLDTTTTGRVLQCGAGDPIWGVSEKGTRLPPLSDGNINLDDGFAAIAGWPLGVYGPGDLEGTEILVKAGGTIAIGDRLKSDASGQAVTASTPGDQYGAKALRSAVSGELVAVQLLFPAQVYS